MTHPCPSREGMPTIEYDSATEKFSTKE